MVEGDEVFGLELLTAGRGELELEVGETLVPGADNVELVAAGFGWVIEDWMEFPGCEGRVVEMDWRASALVDASFDPDLPYLIGEERDAVAGAHNGGEVVLEFTEGRS